MKRRQEIYWDVFWIVLYWLALATIGYTLGGLTIHFILKLFR